MTLSGEAPEFSSSLLSTLNLVDESIRKLNFTTTELLGTRAHELAGLNAEVSIAVSSVAFDHLPEFDRSLGGRLASLSDSYRDIFVGMAAIESPLPDFVVDLPPRDMIVKSTIVKSRTTTFEPADAQIALDDPAYGRSNVDLMLADLDVGYVTMLDEAVEVISGTSLGRVRHGSVSLRELCMHVLRHLAPNDKVRAWTQKPNLCLLHYLGALWESALEHVSSHGMYEDLEPTILSLPGDLFLGGVSTRLRTILITVVRRVDE